MKFLYIDTETTGLDFNQDAIVQLSGIYQNTSTDVEEEFNYHLKPWANQRMSEKATELNHITNEEIATYPDQLAVFKEFNDFLRERINPYDSKDKAYLIGYNIQFDHSMIRSWYRFNHNNYLSSFIWTPGIDVMYIASLFLLGERPSMPNFRLSTVYRYLFKEDFPAHDALADIKATKKVLDYLIAHMPEKFGSSKSVTPEVLEPEKILNRIPVRQIGRRLVG